MPSSSSPTLLDIKKLLQLTLTASEASKFGLRNGDPVPPHMVGASTSAVGCVGVVEAPRIAEVVKDGVDIPKTGDVAALLPEGEAAIWHQEAVASPKLRKTQCNYLLRLGPC